MTNTFRPTVVTAPPGGLARQLATLLQFAVHAQGDTFFDLRRPICPAYTAAAEFAIAPNDIVASHAWWAGQIDSSQPLVYYTALSPSKIRAVMPDARILQITNTTADKLQMAYNSVVLEQWLPTGRLHGLVLHAYQQATTLFTTDSTTEILPNLNAPVAVDTQTNLHLHMSQIMQDPQYVNDSFMLTLLQCYSDMLPVVSSGSADLHVTFESIAAPPTPTALPQVLTWLGGEQHSQSELSSAWSNFVSSAHDAGKRLRINKAYGY